MKARGNMPGRAAVLGIVLSALVFASGCTQNRIHIAVKSGTETKAEHTPAAAKQDTVVWKVTHADFIAIWQEPLNRLLAEKGAPYRVSIEAYSSEWEAGEDAVRALEQMKQDAEPADVIAAPNTALSYAAMADRELLLPLDDFLESEKGGEIKNALHARDLARCRYKGAVYGISAHLRTVGAIAYDSALLKKYGIEVSDLSSDIFENEAVFKKIKDGEGEAVIPYAYQDDIFYALGMWKADPVKCLAYTKDGETVNIFETEALKERLTKLKDWKDKGLLYSVAESRPGSFFARDEMAHRMDPFEYSDICYMSDGQEIKGDYIVVPDRKRPQIAPFWGDAQTAVASWTQNREYALDFLSRLYTDPDIANLILYGTEGTDYVVEDNKAIRLPTNSLWAFGEHFTNALIALPQNDTAVDKMAFQEEYYEQCEPFIPDGFRFDPAPVAAEVEHTNAVYEEVTQEGGAFGNIGSLLQKNGEELDAVLSEINTRLKDAGIDRIILEFDRQLAEWRDLYER